MEREAWQAVADVLDAAIEAVASRPEECARSPGTDFTRNRKLGLDALSRKGLEHESQNSLKIIPQ